MNREIEEYNALQSDEDQTICIRLMNEINSSLIGAENKIWHGHPVWFIEGNPIVGYGKLTGYIQLLFWSGQTFEDSLKPVGKYKAAEARYTEEKQINTEDLTRWLDKSKVIQWDYKNLVKRQGILERLK